MLTNGRYAHLSQHTRLTRPSLHAQFGVQAVRGSGRPGDRESCARARRDRRGRGARRPRQRRRHRPLPRRQRLDARQQLERLEQHREVGARARPSSPPRISRTPSASAAPRRPSTHAPCSDSGGDQQAALDRRGQLRQAGRAAADEHQVLRELGAAPVPDGVPGPRAGHAVRDRRPGRSGSGRPRRALGVVAARELSPRTAASPTGSRAAAATREPSRPAIGARGPPNASAARRSTSATAHGPSTAGVLARTPTADRPRRRPAAHRPRRRARRCVELRRGDTAVALSSSDRPGPPCRRTRRSPKLRSSYARDALRRRDRRPRRGRPPARSTRRLTAGSPRTAVRSKPSCARPAAGSGERPGRPPARPPPRVRPASAATPSSSRSVADGRPHTAVAHHRHLQRAPPPTSPRRPARELELPLPPQPSPAPRRARPPAPARRHRRRSDLVRLRVHARPRLDAAGLRSQTRQPGRRAQGHPPR